MIKQDEGWVIYKNDEIIYLIKLVDDDIKESVLNHKPTNVRSNIS